MARRRELLQGKREKKQKKVQLDIVQHLQLWCIFQARQFQFRLQTCIIIFFSTSYFQMNTQNVVTAYEVLAAFELTSPLK